MVSWFLTSNLTINLMRAIFRIHRVSEENLIDKRYLVEKRAFFKFYRMAYIDRFDGCLQGICNYCLNSQVYDRVTILHPNGANPRMNIRYDKRIKLYGPDYPITVIECPKTFLYYLDVCKELVLQTTCLATISILDFIFKNIFK